MTTLGNPTVRRSAALVGAVVGGYLLYLGANPESTARTALVSLLAGAALFTAVLAVLQAWYRPGSDRASNDEIAVAHEWKVARFLRRAKDAAPLYLGIRLFLAYEWIDSARGKLGDHAWMDTGEALRAYWTRAVQVPAGGGLDRFVLPLLGVGRPAQDATRRRHQRNENEVERPCIAP